MRTILSTIVVALLSLGLAGVTAQAANADRTWVSHNGLAANAAATPPCNPQQPCDTFATALAVTNAGGEINCVDRGSYGPVTITQSVTIDCGGHIGTIDASGSDAITINAAAISVKLRNLTINGNGGNGYGVNISAAAAVTIENCVIQNFNGSGDAGGILAKSPNSLQLNVSDSLVVNNSGGTGGLGISIRPQGTPSDAGTIGFAFSRIRVEYNRNGGIYVIGFNSSATIKGFVRDSVVSGTTQAGILADTEDTTAPTAISVYSSHLVGNTIGVWSLRAAAVILSNTTIQANVDAFSGGGAIFSYGNNDVNANGALGQVPTLISQH